jgi:putative FmdB family regulatory protein
MPRYEYACSSCGKELEIEQRMADDPIKTCPNCHQDTLERLVSRAAFVLKGGGWYSDGYGGSKKTDNGSSSSATPATTETKKSEPPPAAEKPAEKPAAPKPDKT